MGTDAGNPLTLHGVSVYAEMEAMQRAGLAPSAVLVAATRGGATAMGRDKELGTVEKGKLADLLVVAADPLATTGASRMTVSTRASSTSQARTCCSIICSRTFTVCIAHPSGLDLFPCGQRPDKVRVFPRPAKRACDEIW